MSTVGVNISWIFCSECGVLFGLAVGHVKNLEESGDDFHCPNGHVNSFCTEDDYEDDEEEAESTYALTRAHAENRRLRARLRELGQEVD